MNSAVRSWVADVEALTMPSQVVYCDGSKAERDRLIAECLANGELIA
jgi:phosphoenolpyruvate carboxykinase (GTP)